MPRAEDAFSHPSQSVERVKVMEITHGRLPLRQAVGEYMFDDIKSEGPIQCQWFFDMAPVGLSVAGEIDGLLKLDCVRCLSAFDLPVHLNVKERYVFAESLVNPEKERELQADDFYEVVEGQGELDLKDLAHQFLIMEASEHAYCQQDACRFD